MCFLGTIKGTGSFFSGFSTDNLKSSALNKGNRLQSKYEVKTSQKQNPNRYACLSLEMMLLHLPQ